MSRVYLTCNVGYIPSIEMTRDGSDTRSPRPLLTSEGAVRRHSSEVSPMRRFKNLNNLLIGATAAVLGTAAFVPRSETPTPTVSAKAVEIVAKAEPATFVMGGAPAAEAAPVKSGVAGEVSVALSSLSS